MIFFDRTDDDLLIIRCSGNLTEEDVKRLETTLGGDASSHDVQGVMIVLNNFEGYEGMDALIEDVRVESEYRNAFSRIACVTDKTWEKWLTWLTRPFTDAEVRHFDARSEQDALDWLRGHHALEVDIDREQGVVLVEPQAPLAAEDFARVRRKVDDYLTDHDRLGGLVIRTPDFPGWRSLAGLASHFRFIRDMHEKLPRVALVSDTKLKPVAETLGRHLVDAEVKGFAYDALDEAQRWVSNG